MLSGADLALAALALAEFKAVAGRGAPSEIEVAGGSALIIDESYNANPASVAAALALLGQAVIGPRGRRIAVLGDMLELGPEGRAYHLELGQLAGEAGVDLLVTVGPLAAAITERFDGPAQAVADAGEAAAILPELLEPGDMVLVKGSLGVGLKVVCEALGVGDGQR